MLFLHLRFIQDYLDIFQCSALYYTKTKYTTCSFFQEFQFGILFLNIYIKNKYYYYYYVLSKKVDILHFNLNNLLSNKQF